MPAGNMTRLMGQHADHLIGCFCRQNNAGIDKNAAAIGHEGIIAFVVDQHDADIGIAKSGCAKNRAHIVLDQALDFRISYDAHPLRLCRHKAGQHQ